MYNYICDLNYKKLLNNKIVLIMQSLKVVLVKWKSPGYQKLCSVYKKVIQF